LKNTKLKKIVVSSLNHLLLMVSIKYYAVNFDILKLKDFIC